MVVHHPLLRPASRYARQTDPESCSGHAMLKLEQLPAVVVAAGLAIVSYGLFFSWAGGGGYERRERSRDQSIRFLQDVRVPPVL